MLNQYPRWKNVLLILLVLIGMVYAIPNLFPEQPAVQISPANPLSQVNLDDLAQKVKISLQRQNLAPLSQSVDHQTLLLRFSNTDAQLKAKDILAEALGDEYTVAVNLVSSAPHWLQTLGAVPMKLGLDLRGGVHFALEVDMQTVFAQRMQGVVKNVSEQLQKERLRYTELHPNERQLSVVFRDQPSVERARHLLEPQFPQFTVTTQPGYQLVLTWTEAGRMALQQTALDQTMNTLRNRINELGVAEPIVQQQGRNRILVDLPGVQDIARAQQILGGTATIEFRLVDLNHDPQVAQKSGITPVSSQLFEYQGQPVLLNKTVILTGNSITDASTSFDETGRAAVSISLGGGGESYFHRVTGENIGKPLAIVYVETKATKKIISGNTAYIPHKVERIINIATIQTALPPKFFK